MAEIDTWMAVIAEERLAREPIIINLPPEADIEGLRELIKSWYDPSAITFVLTSTDNTESSDT